MSGRMKVGIAGIVIAIVLSFFGVPWWAIAGLIIVALAIPVAGYLTLDKSQRRRISRIRARKQLGR